MIDAIAAINAERARHRLPPLVEHPLLVASATAHSDDMAAHRELAHAGTDGSSPFDRMKAAGYRFTSAAECVGAGYPDAAGMVAGWLADPGHRVLLLGKDYHHVGVASRDSYWTADLAAGMPDRVPVPAPEPESPRDACDPF